MTGECSGQYSGDYMIALLTVIYIALVIFGSGYNAFTAWAERKGYIQGYVSIFVAAGVAVTVAATALVNLSFAVVTAGAFIASGAPMIVGSIWRHVRRRELDLIRQREEARQGQAMDDETEIRS